MAASRSIKNSTDLPLLYRRYLCGYEPARITDSVMTLAAGSCANQNTPLSQIMVSDAAISIDLTTVGLNGLDAGTFTTGVSYQVYVLKNPTTSVVGAIVSAAISYSLITPPSGFSLMRKLPWGFVSINDAGAPSIPPFHLHAWPIPETILTYADDSATWAALSAGTASSFTDVDLTQWIPNAARLAYICVETDYVSAQSESFVRSITSQAVGRGTGTVDGPGQKRKQHMWIRTDSTGKIQYKVTAGGSCSIYVIGYAQTEQT